MSIPAASCQLNASGKSQAFVSQTKAMPHVAVLFYRLGPYHHARLKAAGGCLQITGVEISQNDAQYQWDVVSGADGFQKVTMFGAANIKQLPAAQIIRRVAETLDGINPTVVAVPGWSDACALAALRWCCSRRVPAIMMSETTSWDFQRAWFKETLKRRLIRLCSAGLVGGQSHARYLASLGLNPHRIFSGYDSVDNAYFCNQSLLARTHENPTHPQPALPANFFLASARFVEKKNLAGLIRAYSSYREQMIKAAESKPQAGGIWNLVLLGDGPLKNQLESQIRALHLADHVQIHGFKQYADLPAYYARARVFIHASTTEQWGLVVNEAMAAGLPVLVSNRCGCAMDLVHEGINGHTFDPLNGEQITGLMVQCSHPSTNLEAMGQASKRIIADWGVERFAAGLDQATRAALSTPLPSASALDYLQMHLLVHFNKASSNS